MFYSSDQKHQRKAKRAVSSLFLSTRLFPRFMYYSRDGGFVFERGHFKIGNPDAYIEPFRPPRVYWHHGDSIRRMCFFRALKYVTWIKNILQSCQPQRLPLPPTLTHNPNPQAWPLWTARQGGCISPKVEIAQPFPILEPTFQIYSQIRFWNIFFLLFFMDILFSLCFLIVMVNYLYFYLILEHRLWAAIMFWLARQRTDV